MKGPAATYPLAFGYSVEFTFTGLQLQAAWLPDQPKGKIAKKLLRHYRMARHDFMTKHLTPIFGTIAVVEL